VHTVMRGMRTVVGVTPHAKQAFVLAGVLAAAVAMTSCSDSSTSSSGSTGSSSPAVRPSPTTAAPSPRNTSAFCLDLSTFQVGVLSFRADAGKAIQGEPLDFTELRRKAALIARYGKEMRATAPPDIAEHFTTVLDAVATSARGLKQGGSARAVIEPLYGKRNQAAFEAVQKYECR
jgi:hypothetical protein